MGEVLIQGILCKHRNLVESTVTEDGELIEGEDILYSDLPKEEQYFRRTEVPFSDDDLIAIAAKELTYQGYTPIQKQWVDRENKRFEEGVYAYINGDLTYLPGAYYCYINYWTLEHGEKPDYREDDREFFLFHEYLRLETECLGLLRLKGRRQGATSIAMFFMWFIAGRKEYQNCGTTSFNDGACQDNFQKMFMYGFKSMLPCFQAEFDSDSENFIRFVKPVEKKKKGVLAVKREGLNSYADYKSNAINSYDSGRQSYNVPDETAKRGAKVNINSYWSRLSKTLVIGINKVGFAYMPTTVGQKKEGGEAYKTFFNESDQTKIDPDTGLPYGVNTPTKCVQYFMAATRGYAGCIDKFGRSVIENPKEPVMGNDGRMIAEGAKAKILRDRAKLKDDQLMEHRRDYPLDVFDAFSFEAGICEFNEKKLREQIRLLEEEPVYLRRARLYDSTTILPTGIAPANNKDRRSVSYIDDDSAYWLILEEPEVKNDFSCLGDVYSVNAAHKYVVGADTVRIFSAEHGSMSTICVFKKSCLINGEEKGNYPVAFYIGKPKTPSLLYEEIIKACLFYGCKANIERSAGDHFVEYFYKQGCDELLYWTPARNPNKPDQKPLAGTESASPFQVAMQLECAKLYFDGNNPVVYNGNIHRIKFVTLLNQALGYNHSDRTAFDEMIALMMCLVAALRAPEIKSTNLKPSEILPTYDLKKMNYN